MTVYLDIIWALNFSFDLLLLLLAAKMLKRKVKKWRLMVGALIGSSVVLLLFTPLSGLVSGPVGKFFISIAIVLVTFGFHRFRTFFQNLLMFYFVTFMIGGGMLGTHFFLQSNAAITEGVLLTNSSGMGDPISWLFVIIGFPLLWVFSDKRIDDIKTKKIQYDEIVLVKVHIEGVELILNGLVDSGNQLVDPITKAPVMIIQSSKVVGIFPDTLLEKMVKKDMNQLFSDGESIPWEHRVRVIPYKVVGHDSQFIFGIKPDYIEIEKEHEKYLIKKAIVCVNEKPLSAEGDFDCIVHPKMLQGDPIEKISSF